jgi:hypothetical protein
MEPIMGKYIVQFRLEPGTKNQTVQAFEERGPSRDPGVQFRGAWIGTKSDVVFVLVEASDEADVSKAAQVRSATGNYEIHPVIDIEKY